MKKIIFFLMMVIAGHQAMAQIPDTMPILRDPIEPQPSVHIPTLSDTTHLVDTVLVSTAAGTDTVITKKVHSPRKATLRSLILPGWGQVYNKKYWKVPIVYTAIGIPAYLYFDNRQWFNRTKYALSIVVNERYDNTDSVAAVHPQLKALVDLKAQGSLVNYRNQFRKNMDYSILFTLLMWGVNIIDATVDGHLIGFDVSEDLSLQVRPSSPPGSRAGLSLVLNLK